MVRNGRMFKLTQQNTGSSPKTVERDKILTEMSQNMTGVKLNKLVSETKAQKGSEYIYLYRNNQL
jgi:ABC-type enterochelin transport system substrate-binding protein